MRIATTWPRRHFLHASAGAALAAALPERGRAVSSFSERLAEAQALHRRIPVFLGYCNFSSEQFAATGGRQCDLGKLDAAGVRTLVASIGFGCYFQTGPRSYELAGPDEWVLEQQLKRIDDVVATIKRCPRTRLITRAGELAANPTDNSIGVIVHLTGNNHTIDLNAVDRFFVKGVRASHPAFQYHNRWCAGHNGRPAPVITAFGRKVIARMNELGIQVDTAHASDESAEAMV